MFCLPDPKELLPPKPVEPKAPVEVEVWGVPNKPPPAVEVAVEPKSPPVWGCWGCPKADPAVAPKVWVWFVEPNVEVFVPKPPKPVDPEAPNPVFWPNIMCLKSSKSPLESLTNRYFTFSRFSRHSFWRRILVFNSSMDRISTSSVWPQAVKQ